MHCHGDSAVPLPIAQPFRAHHGRAGPPTVYWSVARGPLRHAPELDPQSNRRCTPTVVEPFLSARKGSHFPPSSPGNWLRSPGTSVRPHGTSFLAALRHSTARRVLLFRTGEPKSIA